MSIIQSLSDEEELAAIRSGAEATPPALQALELALGRRPDDARTRVALFAYYDNLLPRAQEPYEAHALWLVEHVPAATIVLSIRLDLGSTAYERMKVLWRSHLSAMPRPSLDVIFNASFSIGFSEFQEAERVVLDHELRFRGECAYWERRCAFYIRGLRSPETVRQRRRLLEGAACANEQHLALDERHQHALELGARLAVELEDFERGRKLSEQLLTKADQDPVPWRRSNARHVGHTVLGLIAIRHSGDQEAARRFMLAAGSVEGSPHMSAGDLSFDLAAELVARGEIEAVKEYLRLAGRLWEFSNAALPIVKAALDANDPEPFLTMANQRALLGPVVAQTPSDQFQ